MIIRDEALMRRFAEMALRSSQRGIPQWTRFLSPAEQEAAGIEAHKTGIELYTFGGFPNAERRICCFSPDDSIEPSDQLCCMEIHWDKRFSKLSHRDLLGSMLSLGLEREHIGDILVEPSRALVFVTPQMARLLADQLTKAANVPVEASPCELPQAPLNTESGEEIHATVASLRLDALVGTGFHLSRGDAAELIRQGRVFLNYVEETRPDRTAAENAVISVRGLGRCVLSQIGHTTKKGRISIMLLRY